MSKRVKIHYSLLNRPTKSIVSGTMMVDGKTFHDVSDDITKIITERIPSLLKANHKGEDPDNWEVAGFQDWKEYHDRVIRARRQMNAD